MQSESADRTPSATLLYVSNLPFTVEDDELANLFSAHNPRLAYVARRRNGRSKGFGFVDFHDHEGQQAALASANGLYVEDRELNVSVANEDPRRNERGELKPEYATADEGRRRRRRSGRGGADAEEEEPRIESETILYVSNLPFGVEDEDLLAHFAPHGAVAARVARRPSGRSKGFGFVELPDNASQQAALSLDGSVIDDRELQVKVSYNATIDEPPRPRRRKGRRARGGGGGAGGAGGQSSSSKGPSETMLYVASLPFDLDDDALASVFSGYDVVSARVAMRQGRSKGFGFVEFASHEEQQRALEQDGSVVGDRELVVSVAQNERPSRPQREPRETQPSETMVYVANLPFTVDDEALAGIFAEYSVAEAHVATRRNGRSKGFGFVTLSSTEEQQAALAKDGALVDDRPIVVQVAREPVEGTNAGAEE